MNRAPQDRLARLARHARRGWQLARADRGQHDRALVWLQEHPSHRPELDEAWRDCLAGKGPLASWLAGDAPVDAWRGSIPLRCLLASHPFRSLPQWSIQTTSLAS